jgi:predicted glycosyltransferase
MFYSHDTYGLGHLKRTLMLAGFLRARMPALSQLIVTGSPLAHRFQFPPGADYIKLPSVVKVGAEHYEARSLPLPFGTVRHLRSEMLLSAARHFRPDALIVDNVPAGLKGELLPVLRSLRDSSCRLVLGLRDVVDEAEWVRQAWDRDGIYELLDELYDLILVYGRRDIFDIVHEYGFSPEAAAKTRFVGYLRPALARRDAVQIRAELGVGEDDRLVLVMAGGGGDGFDLLRAALEAIQLEGRPGFQFLLLGGPLMPAEHRRQVLGLAGRQEGVHYLDFVDDAASYVAAADVVVSMGGYNSVCELLSLRKPAIVVPRVFPRREQLIRAQALADRGFLRVIHPDELRPERLLEEMNRLVDDRACRLPSLALDGLPAAAAELEALLRSHIPATVALGG